METFLIPGEREIKQWVKEAICEYFELCRGAGGPLAENGEPLLSRTEIAGYLDGISLVTLNTWVKNGLPRHKLGGRVYFLKSEVLEYVKKKGLKNAGVRGVELIE